MFLATWQKVLIVVVVVLVILYVVFVVNELGGVNVPRPEKIEVLKTLDEKQGWKKGEAHWYHHASQGTRILPYGWFVNLERPTIVPSGRLADGEYLERFGFLPGEADPEYNPAGLPIGFAIDRNFAAPYANPPSTGPVVGLTCAACHTGQITYRDKDGRLTGVRIEGGSAMINLAAFQEAVGRSLAFTLNIGTRFERFAKNVLGEDATRERKDGLREELQKFLDVGLASKEYARIHKINGTEGGSSRTDALGLIGNRVFGGLDEENLIVADAPVNFPPLWDTSWFDWVQYNASIRMPMVRNIGEALGVGAPVNLDERKGTMFASTVDVENLHWMEDQLGGQDEFSGLQSPKWKDTGLPEPERARVERGGALYKNYCQNCHLPPIDELKADARRAVPELQDTWDIDPRSKKRFLRLKKCDLQEIGTDPNQAMNFYRRVAVFKGESIPAAVGLYAVTEFIRRDKYRSLKPGGLSCAEAEQYDRYRIFSEATDREVERGKYIKEVLVANLEYKARPLDGIWATPPFLHNSSVPNLYQILVPVEDRDREFYLGTTLFDDKHVGYQTEQFPGAFRLDTSLPGNSNAGHEFRNLTLEEFESLSPDPPRGPAPDEPGRGDSSRKRWGRVLNIPEDELARLAEDQVWKKVQKATHAALNTPRVKRDHPFKGVIGPGLSEEERLDLVEYLKTL
jgi:hypothetical protein